MKRLITIPASDSSCSAGSLINIGFEGLETLVYLTPEKFYDSHPTFISNQGIIEFIIDNDKVLRVNMSKQIKAKMIR